MTIGQRVRTRRKRLKLSQQLLAKDRWSRSYISQVELNKVVPSLDTLQEIANRLDSTIGELIGDSQLLQLAKLTLFTPRVSLQYLKLLPKTDTTIILALLAESLQKNETPPCQLPPDPELHYLTARVLIYQENYEKAIDLLSRATRMADFAWRLRLLNLKLRTLRKMNQPGHYEETQQQLQELLSGIDSVDEIYDKIYRSLLVPDANSLESDLPEILRGLEWWQEFSESLDNTAT